MPKYTEPPTEPDVYITSLIVAVPILNTEEILIAREFIRKDPHIENEYIFIGDGFVDIKTEQTLGWWNQFWHQYHDNADVGCIGSDSIVLVGRYKVYRIDAEWLYCRLERELPLK